jgi:hypothetical protein
VEPNASPSGDTGGDPAHGNATAPHPNMQPFMLVTKIMKM